MESKEHGKQAELLKKEILSYTLSDVREDLWKEVESYASLRVSEAVEAKDKEIAEQIHRYKNALEKVQKELEQAKKENENLKESLENCRKFKDVIKALDETAFSGQIKQLISMLRSTQHRLFLGLQPEGTIGWSVNNDIEKVIADVTIYNKVSGSISVSTNKEEGVCGHCGARANEDCKQHAGCEWADEASEFQDLKD